jgi:hypothetical protein
VRQQLDSFDEFIEVGMQTCVDDAGDVVVQVRPHLVATYTRGAGTAPDDGVMMMMMMMLMMTTTTTTMLLVKG